MFECALSGWGIGVVRGEHSVITDHQRARCDVERDRGMILDVDDQLGHQSLPQCAHGVAVRAVTAGQMQQPSQIAAPCGQILGHGRARPLPRAAGRLGAWGRIGTWAAWGHGTVSGLGVWGGFRTVIGREQVRAEQKYLPHRRNCNVGRTARSLTLGGARR